MTSRLVTPVLVGREPDLAVLEGALGRAAAGQPTTVLVGGDAGIGKTRLVEELLVRAEASGAGTLVGGCVALGEEGLPFAPVVTALRGLLRRSGPEALAALAGHAAPDLARLLPELGEVTGPPPTRDAPPGRLYEVLTGVLAALAEQRPLVVAVEDLHWADRSTRDLLTFCVRSLRDVPVLVVATYRADELRRGHPLRAFLAELDRVRGVERLDLSPLARGEVAAQLGSILDAPLRPGVLDRVFARSEGNPFFVEELAIAEGQGEHGAVTDSLRHLLLARLEHLSADARHVLRVAAVSAAGSLPHALVARVADLPEPALLDGLRAAVDGHVLVADLDRDAYRFRHALVREVLHDELLPGEHARLHLRYAEELEADPALAGESRVGAAVAHHFQAAHALDRALPALVRAAGEARAVYAYAEQQALLERALEIWDRVPDAAGRAGRDHVDVLLAAARAARSAGALDRSLALAEETRTVMDREDLRARDPERAALVLDLLARVLRDLGKRGAFDVLHEALALVPSPTPARARVLHSLSGVYLIKPKPPRALELAAEAAEVARALGDRRIEAGALVTRGTARVVSLGQTEEGLADLAEARRILEEIGDEAELVRLHADLSDSLMDLGRYAEAAREAREGIDVAARIGLARTSGVFLVGNAVEPLIALGRWDEARALADPALDLEPQGVTAGNLHQILGMLALARGDGDAALGHLESAREVFRRPLLSAQYLMPFHTLAAGVAAAQGDLEGVRTSVRAGLDSAPVVDAARFAWPLLVAGAVAESDDAAEARLVGRAPDPAAEGSLAALEEVARTLPCHSPTSRALAARLTAELARARGTDSAALWRPAVAAAREDARPLALASVLLRYAEALRTAGDAAVERDEAAEALREAGALAEGLGARPTVAEAGRLARRLGVSLGPGAAPPPPRTASEQRGLTAREVEVLRLVAAGRTNRQIADALFISTKTASVHVSHILAKLGVAGRGEAAALAHREHLVDEVGA